MVLFIYGRQARLCPPFSIYRPDLGLTLSCREFKTSLSAGYVKITLTTRGREQSMRTLNEQQRKRTLNLQKRRKTDGEQKRWFILELRRRAEKENTNLTREEEYRGGEHYIYNKEGKRRRTEKIDHCARKEGGERTLNSQQRKRTEDENMKLIKPITKEENRWKTEEEASFNSKGTQNRWSCLPSIVSWFLFAYMILHLCWLGCTSLSVSALANISSYLLKKCSLLLFSYNKMNNLNLCEAFLCKSHLYYPSLCCLYRESVLCKLSYENILTKPLRYSEFNEWHTASCTQSILSPVVQKSTLFICLDMHLSLSFKKER